MSDRTIDEATPDTQVTGVENIPVSDGGSPKCVTVTQVKDFVLGKIGTIANVSTPTLATDGVYIKRSSEIKPISASDLADAIIAFAFGKAEVSTLTTEATIVIKSGNDIKTTDVNELAQVVKDAIELNAFDISSLPTATELNHDKYVAITQTNVATSTDFTAKTQLKELVQVMFADIYNAQRVAGGMSNDDYFTVVDGTSKVPKFVKKSDAGVGSGNVTGPAANTDGKIPQWNGTDTKTLKDGLTVVSSVTSTSASTEIPTAAAVHAAISGITVSGDVKGPATSTDGDIATFDGTTGKKIKGGRAVSSAISSSPSTTAVPTEKAVSDCIDAKITSACAVNGTVTNKIDGSISASVASGGTVKTAIGTEITSACATGGAIDSAIDAKIIGSSVIGDVHGTEMTESGWGWDLNNYRIGMCTGPNSDKHIVPRTTVRTTSESVEGSIGHLLGDGTADDASVPTVKYINERMLNRFTRYETSNIPNTYQFLRLLRKDNATTGTSDFYLAMRIEYPLGNANWYAVQLSPFTMS